MHGNTPRRNRIARFPLAFPPATTALLACVWLVVCIPFGRAAELALPRAPRGSFVLPADSAHVTRGEAWLVKNSLGQSLHLHGAAAVRFDLSALQLARGHYRFGLIARTGTRWNTPNGQVAHYAWTCVPQSGRATEPGVFHLLDQPGFQPVRESGEDDSWANWYGVVQAPRSFHLQGNETIEITNQENHGGIVALWLQPVHSLNAVQIDLHVAAPNHAFTQGTRPKVNLSLQLPDGLPSLDAFLVIEWLDLLTNKTAVARSPITLAAGTNRELVLTPDLKPGVYRLAVSLDADNPAATVENTSSASCLLAVSPARLASELPDDWPIAAHVTATVPPLPGFRWYRYFAQWPENHPAPNRYDWNRFDAIFSAVQAVGGRLLIASDGSPVWTSSRGKAGMAWSPQATAYPPDDWNVLRDYLAAMFARYTDARGTLAAIELCNEANTPERWLGDTSQMLAMARVFQTAAAASPHPVKTIGLAVSAGDQRNYVETLVEAGILQHVNAVSAHFYEEMMSPEANTPINNLPRHVAMLREPMHAAGYDLPMINTECGIAIAPRVNGRLPSQEQLNASASADPRFDSKQPWLLGPVWRSVSERRAAAAYAAGIVQLLNLGVSQTYLFSHYDLIIDGAPSLPWVALGSLGDHLHGVDYHHIRALQARYPGSDGKDGQPKALAYLLGKPGGRRVIIAWGFLSDTTVGRSKHWQRWLDPLPLRVEADITTGTLTDLYGRSRSTIRGKAGVLEFSCGEEPVFIEVDDGTESVRANLKVAPVSGR